MTFAVINVEDAAEALSECYLRDGVARLVGTDVEECADSSARVVDDVAYNPFVYAVHLAYAGHGRLVISPDMLWLTIAHGIAQHIKLNAESLRNRGNLVARLIFELWILSPIIPLLFPKGMWLHQNSAGNNNRGNGPMRRIEIRYL